MMSTYRYTESENVIRLNAARCDGLPMTSTAMHLHTCIDIKKFFKFFIFPRFLRFYFFRSFLL